MMTFIQRAMDVNAPADKVFDFIDTPRNVPKWAAGITSVSDIRESEGRIGDTMKATYSVMGMRLSMIWAITEYERPTKLRIYARGGIGGNMSFFLEPGEDTTRVIWEVDYSVGWGPLGKLMDALFVRRMSERNSERTLEALKAACEGE